MNFPRVVLAAVAAWSAYLAISLVVHGVLLTDLYAEHATVMRSNAEQMDILPIGFAFALIGFFAFAYAYAKGYEGGRGSQEGLRFGVLVGMLLCCFAGTFQYMTWPVSGSLFAAWLLDYIVGFAIYGSIVGLLYKRAEAAGRRAVKV